MAGFKKIASPLMLATVLCSSTISLPAYSEVQLPNVQNSWSNWQIVYTQNQTEEQKPDGKENSTQQPQQSTGVTSSQNQPQPTVTAPANQPQATATAATQPTPAAPLSPFIEKKSVSPQFVQEINADLGKLSKTMQNALYRNGYKVTLSSLVTDAVPAAKGQQVRGYTNCARWDQVYAMFNRLNKRVIMAENTKSAQAPNGLAPLADKEVRVGILRHELGHAVDDYLHDFSHTSAFQQAYKKGLARLNSSERDVLKYYLQPGPAGLEETFAELFAAMDSDACDKRADTILRQRFPEVVTLMRLHLAPYLS